MLKLLTAQQIFDKVARQLFMQGGKARSGKNCRLRTTDGRKCAMGALIPDKMYDPALEYYVGCTIDGWAPAMTRALRAGGVSIKKHEDLLYDLQCMHDFYPASSWPSMLRDIAIHSQLSCRVVDQLCTRSK